MQAAIKHWNMPFFFCLFKHTFWFNQSWLPCPHPASSVWWLWMPSALTTVLQHSVAQLLMAHQVKLISPSSAQDKYSSSHHTFYCEEHSPIPVTAYTGFSHQDHGVLFHSGLTCVKLVLLIKWINLATYSKFFCSFAVFFFFLKWFQIDWICLV